LWVWRGFWLCCSCWWVLCLGVFLLWGRGEGRSEEEKERDIICFGFLWLFSYCLCWTWIQQRRP
jgi:hypothetical protein